jgi:hypothetical protein
MSAKGAEYRFNSLFRPGLFRKKLNHCPCGFGSEILIVEQVFSHLRSSFIQDCLFQHLLGLFHLNNLEIEVNVNEQILHSDSYRYSEMR